MRILVVEDNGNKLRQIRTFVESNYTSALVHDATSYTSGLRRIYEEQWDILLLDMTLPVYDSMGQEDGGDKKVVAGEEIMRRMLNRNIIIPTIIITQFDTFGENEISISMLNEKFASSLSDVWYGTVNYEDTLNKWKSDLKILIDKILGEKHD